MRHLVESKNYTEVYNEYTRWIQQNRQYFRTGNNAVKLPDSKVEKPFGFRSYLKTFITDEKEIISVEQDCSEFLSKHPEEFDADKDVFASTFPSIITCKVKKKESKQKKTHAKLNEFFEQKALKLDPPTTGLNDTAKTICALAEKGAKHIKSPDGWEVQF